MLNYHVYIIKSDLGFYYIGQSDDLKDRLLRHNLNRSKYTKNKGKWELVIECPVSTLSEAINLELKLKKMK